MESKSPLASELPLDVLRIIFIYVRKAGKNPNIYDRGARRSLHSCLLVNRQWCQAAVPILWRNSFYYCTLGSSKLIDTYISCFNTDERNELTSKGFILKRSPRYRRSTFPYAAMLKRLDYDRFCGSVDLWCSCTDQELYNARVLLMRALLRLFLTRSVILLHLVLGEWFEKTTTDLKYRRIIEDEFQVLLEPVRKLRIKGNFVKDRILNGLSEPCKNLDKLFVYLSNSSRNPNYKDESTSLQKIIESQTRLKSLKLGNVLLSALLPALPSQSKSLRSINLLDVTFTENMPWNDLFECKNLEKIKFRDCIGFGNNMINSFTSAIFPKLKLLAIVGECRTEDDELLTKDDCHILVEWGLDQGALVTIGDWNCVYGWVKFGQTVHEFAFIWEYAERFNNIYRQYLDCLSKRTEEFQTFM
ncbi:3684_t:CDS:2 [Scutellospora calospora]|uniref:3684_t:CDS:1 n=1 Tax=Scutellospora calospora TaxID=85575 RepID=A0ACA9K7M3_9GLOM|nr:3684_t:CDS:2 [Scutellospora calospora]